MSDVRKIADKMKRQPHNIGSQHRFKNTEGCVFILPRKNPLKAVYIKQIIKIYDEKE